MIDTWLDGLVSRYFKLLLAIVLLVGICLLLVSHMLHADTLLRDLLRDLGIATVVSFVVTVVIESYSARRREADIRGGILDAILGKMIHPALWQEIKSNVIGGFVCEAWHLQILVSREKLTPLSGGPAREQYVSTGTLTYKLTNQMNKNQNAVLVHELEHDVDGQESSNQMLPRFDELTISGMPGSSPAPCRGEELTKFVKGDFLNKPITLPPLGTVEVGLTRREVLNVPGSRVWYMVWVSLSPKITITSEVSDVIFDVVARHPSRERLQEIVPGKEWLFHGVMLPGQGLEIVRKKTELPVSRVKQDPDQPAPPRSGNP